MQIERERTATMANQPLNRHAPPLNPEAFPELYAAAKAAAPHGSRLQHGPNVSMSAAVYKALCAAIDKAEAA